MILHTFPPSPNSVKVMAVIHETGADVDVRIVDLTKGESMTPEFKAINPNGKIPTLEDGDFVLWESQAIMVYIAEKHDSSLVPKDLKARADMHRWLNWNSAHFGAAIGGITWETVAPMLFPGHERNQLKFDESLTNLEKYAPILDAQLGKTKFVTGDTPTLADIALAAPIIHKEMANLPLDGYQNIMSWFGRMMELAYFKKALPQMVVSE